MENLTKLHVTINRFDSSHFTIDVNMRTVFLLFLPANALILLVLFPELYFIELFYVNSPYYAYQFSPCDSKLPLKLLDCLSLAITLCF